MASRLFDHNGVSLWGIGLFASLALQAKANYLAALEVEMQKEWPNNRTVNIVFHGHSVPAGYAATPVVNTFDAYPDQLLHALKRAYPAAVINIIVTAIGGEDSLSGERRFKADVMSHRPDLVFIDYGLNDRRDPIEKVRQAWISMVEMAKAANVKVILLSPTPDLTAKLNDPYDPLTRQAKQIRDIARAEQVGLADPYTAFQEIVAKGGDLKPFMAQSNHPNRSGHEVVLRSILKWFPVAQKRQPRG